MQETIKFEPIRYEYKYSYGLCSETTGAIILGLSIIISIKIVISFVIYFLKRKDKKENIKENERGIKSR